MVILLILAFLVLNGCGHALNVNDSADIAQKIRVEHDAFKKTTTVTGPNCAQTEWGDVLSIRGWKFKEGAVAYQIYIADGYFSSKYSGGSGWRFYTHAYDSDGKTLPTMLIDRHVSSCGSGGCSYIETVGVNIDASYLEAHQQSGITLKISGKGGEEIFAITPTYVQTFLAAAKTALGSGQPSANGSTP